MDKEQLVKKMEWLDDERRKDKTTISDLQKRIAKMEGQFKRSKEKDKKLNSKVTRLGVLIDKVDQYDESLEKYRSEIKKEMDSRDKRAKSREKEARKRQNVDIESMNKVVVAVQDEVNSLLLSKETMLQIQDDEGRRSKQVAELQEKMKSVDELNIEWNQNLKSIADDRRQDEKRMMVIQGELSTLMNRADEQRAKTDLVSGGQKKVEGKLTEFLDTELERRDSQTEFIEGINRKLSDQDKIWKEWTGKFSEFNKRSEILKEYVQSFEEAERSVKKAQETFDQINDQINRRINEITEMQRLGEERFRQEWASFKADDQKRWTNYTLTQEEQFRDFTRRLDRLADQSTTMEDNFQEMRDVVQNLSEQTEKLYQNFLTGLRDWLAENERFASSVR